MFDMHKILDFSEVVEFKSIEQCGYIAHNYPGGMFCHNCHTYIKISSFPILGDPTQDCIVTCSKCGTEQYISEWAYIEYLENKLDGLPKTTRELFTLFKKYQKALDMLIKLSSNYAGLLNIYDGGERRQFLSSEEWITRLEEMGDL